MIERTLLIENTDAVLVSVDHKGELHFIAADTEFFRDMMHLLGHPPNLSWYRVSLNHDKVYPAANGTPKYQADPFAVGLSKPDTRHVTRFVENLKKTPANA